MKRAFSLTEMLIVIAIIGLLAALLFPVVARAKEAARTAPCTSNLRQLHLAWTLYADDHNGGWAPRVEQMASSTPGLWKALICPSDPTTGANLRDTERTGHKVSVSYWIPLPDFRELLAEADPNFGIAYCPLHGTRLLSVDGSFVGTRDTTGLVLRLRRDGSVQHAHVGHWCGDPSPNGFMSGRQEWSLLSDSHCIGEGCQGLTRPCDSGSP